MNKDLKSEKINKASWDHFMNGYSIQIELLAMIQLIITELLWWKEASDLLKRYYFLLQFFNAFCKSSYIIQQPYLLLNPGNSVLHTLSNPTKKNGLWLE